MKKALVMFTLLMALGVWAAAPALADEITDQLERGTKLYKEGKYSDALGELDFATAQIRQKKAETFATAFPEPPAGWVGDKAETQAIAKALFGGGITASKAYRQDKDKLRVKMELVSDSPLLQTLAMVMNNPMLMQGNQGTKLVRIGEEKAMVQTQGSNRAELQMIVDNKILVKVEAQAAQNPEDLAKEFAGKLDIKKLKDLAK